MTLIEQIQSLVSQLPPEKQSEALEFVNHLHQQLAEAAQPDRRRPLRDHPAFGSWRERKIDALQYEQALRAEWDQRA